MGPSAVSLAANAPSPAPKPGLKPCGADDAHIAVNGFNGVEHSEWKEAGKLDLGGGEEEEEEEEEEVAQYDIPEDDVTGFGVDAADVNTPDKWIPRHPQLIRLTGKHPFNCEPPLSRLVDHGFITPTSLHYVRNHGYVPHADWDSWSVQVSGLVQSPRSFSMADLLALPARTLPVTLVCVGNRRKEQNMVKKTRGFNWGAAGVSTSVWKGVRLRDVLHACRVLPARQGAKFVCFEGAETLPAAGGTTYGTSILRSRAMDPAQDVILAYEHNGRPLLPDHGFPVRVIIPGYIGGRMVKWLRKIQVTSEESQSHYHYHDNRVLPSHVDSERADAEKWWYKPEYICNELSINSAASAPAHSEELLLTASTLTHHYLVKGYAYSGGGRKVTRVEVTLDDGASWRVAELEHKERPTEYGKWWCWCFWRLRVDVADLVGVKELSVRAWDEGTNTQPQHLTWNVLGMMNNCWFRIRVHRVHTPEGLALRFEHPTVAGPTQGGWMDKDASMEASGIDSKQAGSTAAGTMAAGKVVAAAARPAAAVARQTKIEVAGSGPAAGELGAAATASGLRRISMGEVREHDSEESPWIVVEGKVYDCTRFLKDHPGGADSILINAGTDVTEEFDAIHSRKARAMLADYLIGDLADDGDGEGPCAAPPAPLPTPLPAALAPSAPPGPGTGAAVPAGNGVAGERQSEGVLGPVTLDPRKRVSVKLVAKTSLSPDVRRFRFALASERHILGLPVGKHMMVCATVGGKLVMRAYTPTSTDDDVGFFELVVKIYFKGVHPQFPEGGLMSQHLEGLQIGDSVEVKGPTGHIHYLGQGRFTVDKEQRWAKKIAMIAGGTGLTPMYQVAKTILKDPSDTTQLWLVFANRTDEDILLQEELDAWAASDPRFHVWYTIESPGPPGWQYSTGRVSKDMFEQHLPPCGEETVAFMCGPPGMIKFGCVPNLEALGYRLDQMFTF